MVIRQVCASPKSMVGPARQWRRRQITFTSCITHQGGWRATIEGVRVKRRFRGSGVGRELLAWAIARARKRGCRLVQLTTDKARPEALRFYESLGFVASHEGMKLRFEDGSNSVP